MSDELIIERAVSCLEREFPPGLTEPAAVADRVNQELRTRGVSVAPERLVELLAADPRVLVEYRDDDGAPWLRLRSAVSEEDARARLVEILIEARTFDELVEKIAGESAAHSHPLFKDALRFLAEGKDGALEESLRVVFSQTLSRLKEER
ncbi:MAG TPA: hypothetical protein VMI54_25140 [Polyangiaceae bacterium]|nr:hypothetical protein [Polyangiaceae bacterium]